MCDVFSSGVSFLRDPVMELKKASFNYSLKNIPIPSQDSHMRGTINKAEQFLQRLRWKVYFFENPSDKPIKETYGFKTLNNAPQSKSLINFEHDLTHLISNLEYSNRKTPFQKQLDRDVKSINNSEFNYMEMCFKRPNKVQIV